MKNTLKYSLHMQKNPIHPDEPEKAYASLQLNGVLDINALAAHMSNHNSIYSKGTITWVVLLPPSPARALCPALTPRATPSRPWRPSPRRTSRMST